MPKPAAKSSRSNTVRIIAGQYRRRLLTFPDGDGLRPTPDRVRETLFNWLGQELHGLHCLDLFAGAGALGFEAASRGAARVVMIEMARPAQQALRDNRALLGAQAVELVSADAMAWLARCADRFDLVFLDPPFASDLLPKALALVVPLLNDGARVYVESAKLPPLAGWETLREGKAGVVQYALLRRSPAETNIEQESA
ncbi:16S rRNA (guanine(966)-N(2))-methyltransferase RsmD [Chitinimonas sp. BJYL2]|uniref:16S rRNA (guanine(966)-N(2))-methyltransferase RsmD n=1 Tax=Chitinimonas sp. BJYL2 TaxID=2976696 RepID=UPI0022B52B35|nr:16S rRNA (guanine(966)-N(2))-methyltransferase RsmD [Chitinimonas sp. BJYL2]